MNRDKNCSSLNSRPERDLSKGCSSPRSRSPLKGGHERPERAAQVPSLIREQTGAGQFAEQLQTVFRVGRYLCSMCYSLPVASGALQVTWEPNVPPPHTLTPVELAQYRAGRNALMAEVAAYTGLRIAIIDA
jgi:hypothetical protein